MGVGSLQDRLKLRSRRSANAAVRANPRHGGRGLGASVGGRGSLRTPGAELGPGRGRSAGVRG